MARLIPSRSTCLPRMTAGEKRVSERLEQKLDDDYLLWYDVPIGLKYSKPDFVVFHPRRGLLVLEVKDWKLETIHESSKDSFTLLTDRGLVHQRNPVAQARLYALEIGVVLERDPMLRHPPESPYAGKLVCPWAYGVVLANITRQQFEDAGLGAIIPSALVICQDEFTPSVDAEALQKRLWDMFPWQFRHALTLPQIDRVRWHLFPEVRVAPGEGQFGLFDGSAKNAIHVPDIIKVMDIQQEQLARSLGSGHRIIHGVAGSGKTMILGYRCAHLAQALTRPILVLCFNKTLAARLEQILGERDLLDKVQVYNFHAWCYAQMEAYHLDKPKGKGMWERFPQVVMDGVEKGLVPRGQYGAILIDEGHDFAPDWYRLVAQMVDPETNALLVLYDDTQNIYGKAERRRFSWKSVGIDAVGHTTILKLNYRNTLEILSVAKAFIEAQSDPTSDSDDGQPTIAPESAGRRGPIPELLRADDRAGEAAIIVARIREEQAHGRSLSDMAIVVRRDADALYFHEALTRAGIDARIAQKSGKSRLFQGGPTVKVVSMHSSKGLEFPLVFIPRVGQMPSEGEDGQLEARLLYVAMTRATEHVMALYDAESLHVSLLDRAIGEIRAAG
ncbi:UvrD/REP helicase N-terminal domain-containing protein [Luteibacter sp. UNCMF366Tsu5.1]|nr:3'-5' exonuclease [Luteibacter sp. UNCMF366Tsu5.1]SFW55697.1 UvrD/REP helicase N-terminal domain-containing protein [Luteibacter sp. UNCMF366Tsu5.1]